MVTEQQSLNYFSKEKPKIWVLIFLIFGVFCGISLLFKGYFWTGIIVAGICALAAFGTHIERKEYPSDDAIDESFVELKDMKYNEILQKIDFDESEMIRKPLSILGIAKYDYVKQGEDGLFRYNPILLEMVVFGKNQLIINEVAIDLINQTEYKARTNEFFYKDISAVSIYDDENGKRFVIKVHGETECDVGIHNEDIELAEEAVKSIRKVLRETKV